MSVSFYVAPGPLAGHRVHCGCSGVEGEMFGDYADAYVRLAELHESGAQLDGCTEEMCVVYGVSIEAVEVDPSPSVNVSGVNAGFLLRELGLYSDDPVGEATGADFRERVILTAAMALDDAGRESLSARGRGGSTWTDIGRRAGYLAEKLDVLHEIADFAILHDRPVYWA